MQFSTRTSNDIHIVAISGSLDSATAPEAQKALDAVVELRKGETDHMLRLR